ncbi:transcription elongation factor GreA [Bacteroidia bacterium]|nr:transcription elongation factor GreA [Bacteroidia bacterium]
MSKNVLLTPQEIEDLNKKLEHLKTVRRPEIAEQIKQARAFGDISENAEYDEAKNDQGKIEGEIATLENLLRTAQVVDDTSVDSSVVALGCTVKVLDVAEKEELLYHVVGNVIIDDEDGRTRGRRISSESPVGKELLGKKVGKTVSVSAPAGTIKLKILEISR